MIAPTIPSDAIMDWLEVLRPNRIAQIDAECLEAFRLDPPHFLTVPAKGDTVS